jgi:hypothetical protein
VEWSIDSGKPPVPRLHLSGLQECSSATPVLKKWLYLPESTEEFESDAQKIADAIRMNDLRFGIEPVEKISKRKKTK